MSQKYGISFPWKRLLGISGLKGKISKKTGIPLTKMVWKIKLVRLL